jgi:hypothetical protein
VRWEGSIERDVLSRRQSIRNAHIHVSEVLGEVGCSGPFTCLGERVALVFSGVPELDEGVGGWGVWGDVD